MSPDFVTVPEKVWLSVPAAEAFPEFCGVRVLGVVLSGACAASGACDDGAVESGVCDDGVCDDGVCPLSGIEGDGVGEVCGVCCGGVVSGVEEGCCA